jgi:3-oxoacyl-[acyl-carrier-protein] synthase-3
MVSFAATAPKLCGIVTALPATMQENSDLAVYFGAETMAKIIAATGIERRPVSAHHTVSDLGVAAAEVLLEKLGWTRDSIGLLIVVTQTPDYPLPSTACIIQNRLGLEKATAAFDLGLGCSGYAYGLSVVSALMSSGGLSRALLVTGDITTRMIAEDNRSIAPLFGDAVAVTALEMSEGGSIAFDLGSDGAGAPYLISKAGGLAAPGKPDIFMDGTQVMAFSLKQVAPSIERALNAASRTIGEMDHVVLHQANAMMLKTLGTKIGAREDQLVYALRDFGNTSSASIPLALCDHLSKAKADLSLLLCGFGVGWSWSTAVWQTPSPVCHDIIRVG